MLGLTEEITHEYYIGDAIATVAAKLLTDGIASSYPCANPQLDPSNRFFMWPVCLGDGLEKYVINDIDIEEKCKIPKMWLEDPDFNLVSWYRWHLAQQGIYEHRYYDMHQELYQKHDPPLVAWDERAQPILVPHHQP